MNKASMMLEISSILGCRYLTTMNRMKHEEVRTLWISLRLISQKKERISGLLDRLTTLLKR